MIRYVCGGVRLCACRCVCVCLHVYVLSSHVLLFQIWMCGGTLEIIPCSRVGHVFRMINPNLAAIKGNPHQKNTLRLVETWLDDYKYLYYQSTGTYPKVILLLTLFMHSEYNTRIYNLTLLKVLYFLLVCVPSVVSIQI